MTENVLPETGTLALWVFGFVLGVALLALGVALFLRAIEKDDKPKIKTSKYNQWLKY